MAYSLPPLPYPTDGLEPLYDKATLEIHHGKHHAAYVAKANAAVEGLPNLADKSIEEVLRNLDAIPQASRRAVVNNGGGHANHSLFWITMAQGKGGEPKGKVGEAIKRDFGSFEEFQKKFTALTTDMFGSGWTFLSADKAGKLHMENLSNQESPISKGLKPILLVDLWEHAYYLKWKNQRPQWVETWWKLVNWDKVEQLYSETPSWF